MTYSLDVKNIFLYKFINEESLNDISKALNVHINTLYYWIIKYDYNIKNKINIELEKKDFFRNTNKKHIYKDSIINFINKNEGCSLNDIYHVNKQISKSTIINIIKENNITHKRYKIHVL
jgi:hypothetical protein